MHVERIWSNPSAVNTCVHKTNKPSVYLTFCIRTILLCHVNFMSQQWCMCGRGRRCQIFSCTKRPGLGMADFWYYSVGLKAGEGKERGDWPKSLPPMMPRRRCEGRQCPRRNVTPSLASLPGDAAPLVGLRTTNWNHGLHGRRALRSASSSRLVVPMFRLSTVGSRTFNVSGPRIWNGLPGDVVSAPTLSSFRHRLKPFLFQ